MELWKCSLIANSLLVWRNESFYFRCVLCFLTQMISESFWDTGHPCTDPSASGSVCAWHVWEQGRVLDSAQESWAKSCSPSPREARGFGYMDKSPSGTSCADAGCLHGAAALWRELGKESGCFLKSCGCLSMVLGPGSAFELGVRSRLLLCSVYAHKDFVEGNKTMCSKSPLNLNFLLNWGFNVLGLVALLSHVRVASLLGRAERGCAENLLCHCLCTWCSWRWT